MPFDGNDRRQHPRQSYLNNIYFCLNPHSHNETLLGVSTNISDSGICFYTFSPLEAGQAILFKSDLPLPYRRATVQWVKKFDRNFYKVGLMFCNDSVAEEDIGVQAGDGKREDSADSATIQAAITPSGRF